MGEWKAQVSLRVRQELRRELEDFALKEGRKLGDVGEVARMGLARVAGGTGADRSSQRHPFVYVAK